MQASEESKASASSQLQTLLENASRNASQQIENIVNERKAKGAQINSRSNRKTISNSATVKAVPSSTVFTPSGTIEE